MTNDSSSGNMANAANAIGPVTETESQMRLTGILKQNSRTEMVVFTFTFLMVDVTAIVVIPAEGTLTAPVYLKFKLRPTL